MAFDLETLAKNEQMTWTSTSGKTAKKEVRLKENDTQGRAFWKGPAAQPKWK